MPVGVGDRFAAEPNEVAFSDFVRKSDVDVVRLRPDGEVGDNPIVFGGVINRYQKSAQRFGGRLLVCPQAGGQQLLQMAVRGVYDLCANRSGGHAEHGEKNRHEQRSCLYCTFQSHNFFLPHL